MQGQARSIRDEADSLKAQVQGDFTTEAFTIMHTLYFLCRIMMRLCKLLPVTIMQISFSDCR